MCGIMGYAGSLNSQKIILTGLSRLEYRGYDSAGISYQENGSLQLVKKEGKLVNLENAISKIKIKSRIGIGHTRWATHGKVNDTNAHPHQNEEFSIVHNGIIENANQLREFLQTNGHKFKSETDSEVFLELLSYHYKQNQNIQSSIFKAYNEIEGNSAFVIMQKDSHKLYAIKRSAPIVCGLKQNEKEVFVSSDPYALMGQVDNLYFPEDGVLIVADYLSSKRLIFLEENETPSSRFKLQKKELNEEIISKGNFDHFMHKEIHEQPLLVSSLVEHFKKDYKDIPDDLFKGVRVVHLVSCGTALYAGMVIKNFIEARSDVKVLWDFASEFRYKNHRFSTEEVALFISQSGETADTLACQEICKEHGLKTYSIVNVEGSTLFRNCDYNFLSYAGTEIGVASTKAFTQQVLVGHFLTLLFLRQLDYEKVALDFKKLASAMNKILDEEDKIKQVAQKIYNYKGFIFTGRGIQFPIALEGALKLKEIAYVHAEGYAAGELKHGPIALIDENMVNIAIITPDLYKKTYSNAQEVKARKGKMVVIGDESNKELEELADYFIGLELTEDLKVFEPLVTNLVLQLLSYNIAKLKGTDIDKPRNLAKSVTVE